MPLPPQNFSGLFLKVLHRPLTAPLVAKLTPPVPPPQMKMSGSAPGYNPRSQCERQHLVLGIALGKEDAGNFSCWFYKHFPL